jgi:hypothetical protein
LQEIEQNCRQLKVSGEYMGNEIPHSPQIFPVVPLFMGFLTSRLPWREGERPSHGAS